MSDRLGFEGSLVDGQFSMGRVVSQTFSTIGRNLAAVATVAFVISLVVVLLASLVSYMAQQATQDGVASLSTTIIAGLVALLIGLVVRTVSTGGITHIALSDLNGGKASVGQALATGFRLAFPLLGLGIVVGLGVGLASLLLLVPGLMLAMRWAVAVPARVVEGPPMSSALARSGELTAGNRWRIFGLFVALAVFGWVVTFLANGLGYALLSNGAGTVGMVATAILQIIASTVTTSVSATGVAVLYAELRRIKEGATPNQLAAVFA